MSSAMGDAMSPSPSASPPAVSELTPRSKIAALMAEIGSDSESDGYERSNRVTGQRSPLKDRGVNAANHIISDPSVHGPFEDEESEEEAIVPRGKIARRLHGASILEEPANSDVENDDDKENAYARVRKQLFGGLKANVGDDPVVQEDLPEQAQQESPASSPVSIVQSSPTQHIHSHELPPRLFLTPSPEKQLRKQGDEESDEDLPAAPEKDSKFLALVAKQTEKRKAKEAKEKARRKELERERRKDQDLQSLGGTDESDDMDKEVASRLTQQTDRPARKASKRAVEEMNRETQRINRNMQLAHQAKTKKKITKESLLARFQFGAAMLPTPDPTLHQINSTTASSAPASDRGEVMGQETPPTSPIHPPEPKALQQEGKTLNELKNIQDVQAEMQHDVEDAQNARMNEDLDDVVAYADDEGELPDLQDVMIGISEHRSKGKGKAVDMRSPSPKIKAAMPGKYVFKQKPIRIHPDQGTLKVPNIGLDSDDDLEVIPSKTLKMSRLDAFERVPKAENADRRSLRTLRALAHLQSPPSKQGRAQKYLSSLEMQNSLHQRARQQALEERQAKIEELKAKGIIVQTAEEREKEQVEVEDLLERARRENNEIREKEKKAAKKAKAIGETVDADDLSSEGDEDYEGGEGEESDIEVSGSDEEDVGDENEGDVIDEATTDDDKEDIESLVKGSHGLIDGEASDDSRDEVEIEAEIEALDENEEDGGRESNALKLNPRRRRIMQTVLDDEDEEDDQLAEPASSPPLSFQPESAAAKIPAIFQKKADSVPFGLTQAFAATMADTQVDTQDLGDSPMIFESPPEPALPPLPALQAEDSLQMIENTQELATFPEQFDETEDQDATLPIPEDSMEGIQRDIVGTQYSELPDPTQDEGFGFSSPGPEHRFVSEPPSTVATVIVPANVEESPVAKKRGRLQRRNPTEDRSDSEVLEAARASRLSASPDAYAKMRRKREAALESEQFNKKKSNAKEMVEEQAQESEDEYAGLGGASDEDSNEEDEEFVREMIDQGDVNVDERKLAALHADRQRTDDTKAIEKLYKDITNGGLRRKRHSEFDLSDSEDDAVAIRKRKQREFAKMRKRLLENENVGKIAEDPKKLAFLKAIEDREDNELDFLDGKGANDSFYVEMETQEGGDSQALQQENTLVESLIEGAVQPLQPAKPSTTNMRPPPNMRRTPANAKRPATLAEIKQSLSYLVEEPGSFQLPSSGSESENEDSHDDDDALSHISDSQRSQDMPKPSPRRTTSANNIIVDRLLLKRQSSSSLSSLATSESNNTLAFHSASTTASSSSSFVPSLLRRATTNSSIGGVEGGAATTERAAGGEKAVKIGGGKKISVNFRKREGEKERIVGRSERRRKEEREKLARQGRQLGGLARGMWEA